MSAQNMPETVVCDGQQALDTQNAPETDIPMLLAIVVNRAGMVYNQFWRQGDVAIYRAEGKGNRLEFEVIKIQILPAGELGGRSYPPRESLPSNSEWGESGWTFTNNSDRDPLAAAFAKAQQFSATRKQRAAACSKDHARLHYLEPFRKGTTQQTL